MANIIVAEFTVTELNWNIIGNLKNAQHSFHLCLIACSRFNLSDQMFNYWMKSARANRCHVNKRPQGPRMCVCMCREGTREQEHFELNQPIELTKYINGKIMNDIPFEIQF